MKIKTGLIIIASIALVSCQTTSNSITYFQDIENQTLKNETTIYETKICPDDLLEIAVSSIEPAAVSVFNLGIPYLVDNAGYIDYPVLGKIHVAGKTRAEITDLLKEKISVYAKSPIVTLQLKNFKISVLGEVAKPGTVQVPNERVSILDAIGLAGDLTIYGQRSNVMLIRDNNGKKEYHQFDLTKAEILNSPYYYLQQNDIVYIEPNKARKGNSKYSQSAQFNISVASTVVGAISVIASLTIALLVK